MTLFEAIRELREGQRISTFKFPQCYGYPTYRPDAEQVLITWKWGTTQPKFEYPCYDWEFRDYSIIDLPKPKMTLEEGLEKAIREIQSPYINPSYKTKEAETIADILRSLPIDWQAEADRKEGE